MDKQVQNPSLSSLVDGYFTNQAILDECFQFNEGAKESWKQLLSNIETLGVSELKDRKSVV